MVQQWPREEIWESEFEETNCDGKFQGKDGGKSFNPF